jgi:hypothetical protein
VAAAPPPPPKPDSVVVRVYRADKLIQQKFEKNDSTSAKKSDSTSAPARP